VIDGPVPPGDVRVEGGRLLLDVGSQNYGDSSLRLAQQMDFAGRTTTLSFDTVLWRGSDWGLFGWNTVVLTDGPYTAPGYPDDNSDGPVPQDGVAIHFNLTCGQPVVRLFAGGVQTMNDSHAHTYGDCTGQPTTAPGQLNRVTVAVSQSGIRICVSDAGATAPKQCWDYAMRLPFSRSFVSFGGHNHASIKYGFGPSWQAVYDNITFDGPVVPPARVSEVADGPGRDVGHPLPASGGTSLVLPNVDLTGASTARLLLNARVDSITNRDWRSFRLVYRLNGGTPHEVPFTLRPNGDMSAGNLFSIPISLNELQPGANTLQLNGVGFYGGYQPYVANIDLVVQ
jgi:hypothetical protein